MNDDIDIEEVLKRHRIDPGPQVKRSVLSRFALAFGNTRPEGTAGSFWKRPVPLYVAAAAFIIAVGLSFFAGQRMAPPERQLEPSQETYSTITHEEVQWEVAPNDLF